MKIVNFVNTKNITVMTIIEKREYIYSHLHHVDESLVNEVFEKMFNIIENADPTIGYDAETSQPLSRNAYKAEMERRETEIENGDYILHEDLKKESKNW
jgi:lipoate synthase